MAPEFGGYTKEQIEAGLASQAAIGDDRDGKFWAQVKGGVPPLVGNAAESVVSRGYHIRPNRDGAGKTQYYSTPSDPHGYPNPYEAVAAQVLRGRGINSATTYYSVTSTPEERAALVQAIQHNYNQYFKSRVGFQPLNELGWLDSKTKEAVEALDDYAVRRSIAVQRDSDPNRVVIRPVPLENAAEVLKVKRGAFLQSHSNLLDALEKVKPGELYDKDGHVRVYPPTDNSPVAQNVRKIWEMNHCCSTAEKEYGELLALASKHEALSQEQCAARQIELGELTTRRGDVFSRCCSQAMVRSPAEEHKTQRNFVSDVSASGPGGEKPLLKTLDYGKPVGNAQAMLKYIMPDTALGSTGLDKNGIDDDYGNLTRKAVSRFQAAHKLTGVQDGVLDKTTYDALGKAFVEKWNQQHPENTITGIVDQKGRQAIAVTRDFLAKSVVNLESIRDDLGKLMSAGLITSAPEVGAGGTAKLEDVIKKIEKNPGAISAGHNVMEVVASVAGMEHAGPKRQTPQNSK